MLTFNANLLQFHKPKNCHSWFNVEDNKNIFWDLSTFTVGLSEKVLISSKSLVTLAKVTSLEQLSLAEFSGD